MTHCWKILMKGIAAVLEFGFEKTILFPPPWFEIGEILPHIGNYISEDDLPYKTHGLNHADHSALPQP